MRHRDRAITLEIFSDVPDVLVVEDDADVAAGLMDVITAAGFSVSRAANGRQGLDHAESWPPRVVLLDLRMPVMDGWAFLERWRVHSELSPIPVVIVSSEPVDSALRPSVQAWLPKPVDEDELVRVVGSLLLGRLDEHEGVRSG